MKIVRNGIEIELTEQEIEDAYRERRRYYNMEDVRSSTKSSKSKWANLLTGKTSWTCVMRKLRRCEQ